MCGVLLGCARCAEHGARELAEGWVGQCIRTAGQMQRVKVDDK